MYDCADYRRHAEIGGHYSVDFIAYRPRRNCHLLTRRFARALGLAVSLSVITAFAGVYLSFILIARQRRPSWYYLPSCLLRYLFTQHGATGVMKSYQRRKVNSSVQKINTTVVVESHPISVVGQYGKQLSLNFFTTSVKISCFTPHVFPVSKFFQSLANPA